ncbi:MAG: PorP/SprF family type IX secretion system membrane protein, partial [Saprospiraceae bacterium]|nr:PorP/SprF family type IX secretion system membrane protein [Saprospiraceae bacterium]
RKKKNNSDDAIGLGIMFFNDKVGIVDFSTTQIAVSLAYHKALGADHRQFLTLGIQGGLTQRNVNYSTLQFHDSFDGGGGYTIPTAEVLPGNNFAYADYNAGLNYKAEVGKNGRFFAGAAFHHFLQPEISFYENNGKGDKLYSKLSTQIAASIPLTNDNRVQFHPRLLWALQGPHMEINAGTNFRFAMGKYGSSAIHFGAWARPVRNDGGFGLDAAVALLGVELNNMVIGLSYDLNLKALQANQRQGALELSITYLGNYNNEEIVCPKF